MRKNLRSVTLVLLSSLLWACPVASAAQKAQRQQVAKGSKHTYIGTSSWYGRQHQGRKMANGQRFDRRKLTAACWFFPLGTTIRVLNLENGKSVVVTITDRGPNHRLNRALDLSEAAATELGFVKRGLTTVLFSPVEKFELRQAELDAHLLAPASPIVRDQITAEPLKASQ